MRKTDIFKTIVNPVTGIYKEKGSKFLAYVFPVSNEENIKEILTKIRKEHHGARHHCYSWCLGPEMKDFRLSDDGEPSGTAGRPIFRQIQSRELTNILVIVVRYFGGILLGTSGLINAYTQASLDALNKAVIIEKVVEDLIEVNFDYALMDEFMRIIKEMKLSLIHSEYSLKCSATFAVRQSVSKTVLEKLNKIDHLNASIVGNNI
jgi:uncharacterized YigZ family protein